MDLPYRDFSALNLQTVLCGDVDLNPLWNTENGYAVQTRLFFVYKGGGYLRTDTETIQMMPGYVYLIPSKTKLAYGCTRLKKLFFNIKLTTPTEKEDILSSVGRILQVRYDPSDLDTLRNNFNSNDCFAVIQVQSLLYKNLFRLLTENNATPISLSKHSALVKRAIRYIIGHARTTLTIKELSNILYVSESKLRTSFEVETGISIGRFIDSCVMQKARQLLENSYLSISEISSQLGFCDQFYFSRQFKKNYGIPPSAHRRKYRKTDCV